MKKATKLDRLLQCASASISAEESQLPFPLEARVLAAWRRAHGDQSEAEWSALIPFLRRALAAAGLTLALSLGVVYADSKLRTSDDMGSLNAVVNVASLP